MKGVYRSISYHAPNPGRSGLNVIPIIGGEISDFREMAKHILLKRQGTIPIGEHALLYEAGIVEGAEHELVEGRRAMHIGCLEDLLSLQIGVMSKVEGLDSGTRTVYLSDGEPLFP